MTLPTANTPTDARRLLVDDLRKHLIGPITENELLTETPINAWHTGSLAPSGGINGSGVKIDAEEDDLDGDDSDDSPESQSSGENILSLANISQQSAMGLTFQIASRGRFLNATVEWGQYRSTALEPLMTGAAECWQRSQVRKTVKLDTHSANGKVRPILQEDQIVLYAVCRPEENGIRMITLSVVNERDSENLNENRIFQVGIHVAELGGNAVFCPRPPAPHLLDDDETWNFELLYRNRPCFAVGHGCAVEWDTDAETGYAKYLRTSWIPATEVLRASADIMGDSRMFRLEFLADPSARTEIIAELRTLPAAYKIWIEQNSNRLESILTHYGSGEQAKLAKAGRRNLSACEQTCERISKGINKLEVDPIFWKSFQMMNDALSRSMRRRKPTEKPAWRAFQLAFILLAGPSSVDSTETDREILDLIWFPTGGGKTEAYLGLSAWCIFHRRLTGNRATHGVCVLSRYTLRLLTVQQFERTTRVIMACELIRRERPTELGQEEISLGLFVGQGGTPTRLEDARKMLEGSGEAVRGTTLPIPSCPWCRETLTKSSQAIIGKRLKTPCPNEKCPFHSRLPISVIDEEIYAHPPAMLIGTVDKLAMMAWQPDMSALFGIGDSLPPSLIIQDELHLITDSLGTITALYETAVDHLCRWNGRPAKVIGSTATIRRAEEQCRKLFNRSARQFPPSGIDVEDSFFYTEDRQHPGRMYVGVHAQGRSPKHTLAWTTGTLLQAVTPVRIPETSLRDSYHTAVLYFNSMRELGGALVLADDDIPAVIKRLARIQEVTAREIIDKRELSGQVRSDQIRDLLTHIETGILPQGSEELRDREALDLLLSTNMISVGVDVDRLSLILINGQPKTTAEYIQASSRVGRPVNSAGLVVTLYNWTRPRDRSHYERFVSYHQCFYRHVESTSVTPFSSRARDRALHAVLASMSRLGPDGLGDNSSAVRIREQSVLERVGRIATIIGDRARDSDPDEEDETREHLARLIEEWCDEAAAFELVWRRSNSQRYSLLQTTEERRDGCGKWPTLMSMRDVDPASPVLLLTRKQLKQSEGH